MYGTIQNIWSNFNTFFQTSRSSIQITMTTCKSSDYAAAVHYVQDINTKCTGWEGDIMEPRNNFK